MYFFKKILSYLGSSTDPYKQYLDKVAIQYGYHLVEITKHIDKMNPTDLSRWMDTVNGHSGGWYHRVKHGHDFAANFIKVKKKFGSKGVAQYPFELAKDFCTPHGVPIPGSQWLVEAKVLSAKTATEWASLNIADVFVGGVGVYSTFKLYKKAKNGKLSKGDVVFASIGIGVKIQAGVTTTNPVILISAGADTVILVQNIEELDWAISGMKKILFSKFTKVSMIGALSGISTVAITYGSVSVLGAASTGTAIVTLSGAAASNATLAAIGFGSIATGGAGIVGGIAVLSAIGATGALIGGLTTKKLLDS